MRPRDEFDEECLHPLILVYKLEDTRHWETHHGIPSVRDHLINRVCIEEELILEQSGEGVSRTGGTFFRGHVWEEQLVRSRHT